MTAAVIVVGGSAVITLFLPDGQPTPANGPSGSFVMRAAEYLNTKCDHVEFYWMCNSTFLNVNMHSFMKPNSI